MLRSQISPGYLCYWKLSYIFEHAQRKCRSKRTTELQLQWWIKCYFIWVSSINDETEVKTLDILKRVVEYNSVDNLYCECPWLDMDAFPNCTCSGGGAFIDGYCNFFYGIQMVLTVNANAMEMQFMTKRRMSVTHNRVKSENFFQQSKRWLNFELGMKENIRYVLFKSHYNMSIKQINVENVQRKWFIQIAIVKVIYLAHETAGVLCVRWLQRVFPIIF